jgi:hypothetical protein
MDESITNREKREHYNSDNVLVGFVFLVFLTTY